MLGIGLSQRSPRQSFLRYLYAVAAGALDQIDRPYGSPSSTELSTSTPVSSPGYVPYCQKELGTKYLLYLTIIRSVATKKYIA